MRNHESSNSRVTAITGVAQENSVNQARWILVPLFGLWFLFIVAGGML